MPEPTTPTDPRIDDAWWRAMEAGDLPRPRGDGTARQLFEAGYRAALAAPQGEPSDAQVPLHVAIRAVDEALRSYDYNQSRQGAAEAAVAALRAASAVTEQAGLPGNPGVSYDDIGGM